jgi:hypothetical protein
MGDVTVFGKMTGENVEITGGTGTVIITVLGTEVGTYVDGNITKDGCPGMVTMTLFGTLAGTYVIGTTTGEEVGNKVGIGNSVTGGTIVGTVIIAVEGTLGGTNLDGIITAVVEGNTYTHTEFGTYESGIKTPLVGIKDCGGNCVGLTVGIGVGSVILFTNTDGISVGTSYVGTTTKVVDLNNTTVCTVVGTKVPGKSTGDVGNNFAGGKEIVVGICTV